MMFRPRLRFGLRWLQHFGETNRMLPSCPDQCSPDRSGMTIGVSGLCPLEPTFRTVT
jgi:hypothetical protein